MLGVDPAVFNSVYGLGAGLFFIGYFIFEVPSNLILHRVGARVWIARIMILWGFVSMAMMFIQSTTMFYVMRFLLGAAEAGFFPGVMLYLTYWYPHRERARTIALFALGGVLAGVVGSPISGAILGMDGIGGLAGWQWLFLLEAIPAVLMGVRGAGYSCPTVPATRAGSRPRKKPGCRRASTTRRRSRCTAATPPAAGRLHQRARLAASACSIS